MSMHIDALPGEVAERIVLVGDPNRAKFFAGTFLENPKLVNEKRCAYLYTGMFEGKRASVMAVGMGGPSMTIYATELCRDYGCKVLVRAGTCGCFLPEAKSFDIVLSQAISSTGGMNREIFNGHFSPCADFGMLCMADRIAGEMGLKTYVGGTIANDRLYRGKWYQTELWKQYGILAAEQEGEAFYTTAAEFGCKALMMLGTICGISVDENGQEKLADLPAEDPPHSVYDLGLLAFRTVVRSAI